MLFCLPRARFLCPPVSLIHTHTFRSLSVPQSTWFILLLFRTEVHIHYKIHRRCSSCLFSLISLIVSPWHNEINEYRIGSVVNKSARKTKKSGTGRFWMKWSNNAQHNNCMYASFLLWGSCFKHLSHLHSVSSFSFCFLSIHLKFRFLYFVRNFWNILQSPALRQKRFETIAFRIYTRTAEEWWTTGQILTNRIGKNQPKREKPIKCVYLLWFTFCIAFLLVFIFYFFFAFFWLCYWRCFDVFFDLELKRGGTK